jgi:carboxypeptidase Q
MPRRNDRVRNTPGTSAFPFLAPLAAGVTLTVAALVAFPHSTGAQVSEADRAMVQRIVEEGVERSQVMEHVIWLADVLGPRLTGSPAFEAAGAWAVERLQSWGLENVRLEHFPLGRGWTMERFSAHLLEPQVQPLVGMPKSWTDGTGGPVVAEVVYAPILVEEDLERYRGRLAGKIVLTQTARDVNMIEGRVTLRMTEAEIEEARTAADPRAAAAVARAASGEAVAERTTPPPPRPPAGQIRAFYEEEGALALLERGPDSDMAPGGSDLSWTTQRLDGGTIFVTAGGSRDPDAAPGLPNVVLAVEHYNRMVRVLERGVPVRMELDVRTRFHPEPPEGNGFNVLAEIRGSDPRVGHEVVLLGGHLDSHHGATGATDNATGVAAMMEAMRILKALDARPRRTVRVGLWGAEEQGLLGARSYVERHLLDEEEVREGHAGFSAYYNLDNGTGAVRGIWLEGNQAAGPVFSSWMDLPELAALGVDILGPRVVGSTDHVAFTRAGLPGFQFIQERLEYRSRTHHTNMDTVDRVQPECVRQQAVVAAIFAWLTAQHPELIPRPR